MSGLPMEVPLQSRLPLWWRRSHSKMPVLPVTLPLRPPLHKLLQSAGATSGAATTVAAVEAVITEATMVATTRAAAAKMPSSLGERVGVKPPNIKGPSTRTCQKGSGVGVPCISAGGVPPFSVPNPDPAHGKMCLNKNETVTSPVIWMLNY